MCTAWRANRRTGGSSPWHRCCIRMNRRQNNGRLGTRCNSPLLDSLDARPPSTACMRSGLRSADGDLATVHTGAILQKKWVPANVEFDDAYPNTTDGAIGRVNV
eukprot:100438-Prymnesium_polylepis.2